MYSLGRDGKKRKSAMRLWFSSCFLFEDVSNYIAKSRDDMPDVQHEFLDRRQILLSFCVNLRESAVAGLFDNCPRLRRAKGWGWQIRSLSGSALLFGLSWPHNRLISMFFLDSFGFHLQSFLKVYHLAGMSKLLYACSI